MSGCVMWTVDFFKFQHVAFELLWCNIIYFYYFIHWAEREIRLPRVILFWLVVQYVLNKQ